MIKMVVFDMAGTTVDEDNVVYKTLHKAMIEAGFQVTLDQVLLYGAGKEKLQAIVDVMIALGETAQVIAQAAAIFEQFNGMLKKAYDEMEVRTFDGTEDVFRYLQSKQVKVVLNTGYNRPVATKLLNKLEWEEGRHYDLLITADDVERGRPYPDMIWLAMNKLGIDDPKSVVKIGDSAIDIEEGKAAGCGMTLGVTTGAQTADQIAVAQPDHIVHTLEFLKTIV